MPSDTPQHRSGPQSQWSTLCVHAGEDREPKPRGAVTDPIFCTSTYAFADTQSLIDFIEKKLPREEYARYGNPTEKTVERKLAVLEGAEDCVLYATGMAAVTGLFMAKLNAGDELVFFDELYQRTREALRRTSSAASASSPASCRRAISPRWKPPSGRPRGSCSARRRRIRN